jgi:hypothetical protein
MYKALSSVWTVTTAAVSGEGMRIRSEWTPPAGRDVPIAIPQHVRGCFLFALYLVEITSKK